MKKIKILPIIILAFAVILPVFVSSSYIIQSLVMILLYAYWASSWNIIGGYAGHLSLGHATYAGIGAYTSTVLFSTFGVSPWIGMLVGGLLGGLLSIIIGYPCFKLKGSYFTLATIALLYVVQIVFMSEDKIFGFTTNGAMGMSIPLKGESFVAMQFMDKRYYYYIALAMLVIVMIVSNIVKSSKMGYYLAAITTNQDAASSLGVNVPVTKLKAQFISAFFTAIGGTFYAQLIMFIDPTRILGYDLSLQMAMFVIIGGRATVWGPVIGALMLVPINELTRSYLGAGQAGLSVVVYGIILMAAIYFMPFGIEGHLKKLAIFIRSKLPGKISQKEGIQ